MNLIQRINTYIDKQKTRKELADLPEHLWQDIGLSKEQVQSEIAKASLSHTISNKVINKLENTTVKASTEDSCSNQLT